MFQLAPQSYVRLTLRPPLDIVNQTGAACAFRSAS